MLLSKIDYENLSIELKLTYGSIKLLEEHYNKFITINHNNLILFYFYN